MHRALAMTVCCVVGPGLVAHAQDRPHRLVAVHGAVQDTAFRPVPGVLVFLGRARIFSLTDEDGKYRLPEVQTGEDTLHIRARGFESRSFRLFLPDSVYGSLDLGPAILRPGPPPTLALDVRTRDTLLGQPVADAEVLVNEQALGTTDTAGRFARSGIPIEWGTNTLVVRRIGFTPVVTMLWVDALDARWSVDAVLLRQAVGMPAIVVEGDRVILAYGRMRDFWLRRERGWGWYLTQAEIERRRPVYLSDMLRMIPGVQVQRRIDGTRVTSTRGGCVLSVWLDGAPLLNEQDPDLFVRPMEVAGVEVYSGIGRTPPEFTRGGLDGCGAIVIWTK